MNETKVKNIGFQSIHLEAAHNVTIKRGLSVKCNATFTVSDGVLYANSENDSITLVIPQVELDTIEIESQYDSIKCDGLQCNQLTISSAHNVKIENSIIDRCEISSEYDSIHILKSKMSEVYLDAAHNVNVELDDFDYIEIDSQYDGVKIIYNGKELVNVDCTSTYGTVKADGPFYGDENCDKKIVIKAAQGIKLISRNK